MLTRHDFFERFAPPSHDTGPIGYPVINTPGKPRQYVPGDVVFVREARAWLLCDDLGFYAVEAVCPHLGGIAHPAGAEYVCPLHGSHFTAGGECDSGVALRGLRFLEVTLDRQGQLAIVVNSFVSPDERFIA